MILLKEIHNAVAELLKEHTTFETYSNEVKENIVLPCFYCAVTERPSVAQNAEVVRREVDVTLNFLPEVDDSGARKEVDGLQMQTMLGAIFGNLFKVSDRHLMVRQQAKDYGGENSDIPLFSFTLDFFDDLNLNNSDEDAQADKIEQVTTDVRVRAINT